MDTCHISTQKEMTDEIRPKIMKTTSICYNVGKTIELTVHTSCYRILHLLCNNNNLLHP